ncbi:tartrate dehydrogenase [Brevibacterium permense]|uniref:isocitrate/isopropylmalate family dehydrogenase n=1 Tax=Brevibacterium permense TaxID=234834 RepID=UPI0021D00689|nr:isocitrate/isopropylmalate family dehydrogenase [Brevibacterium permense]MCU4298837.1 tartrate dehydrogenase [Brevibacterium permense]
MKRYTIDCIAGDGIGQEVVPTAVACIDAVAEQNDSRITWRERNWSSDRYLSKGAMMPVDGIDQLDGGDGILLGAVGHPEVPDHITLWGLLIPIRRAFDLYLNIRPVRLLPGIEPRVVGDGRIDTVIVRENVEGEYSEVGGRAYQGTRHAMAFQQALFTRRGVKRVTEYAAELAAERSGKIISATKLNGLIHSMTFWDEVVEETLSRHTGVELQSVLIDALAARLVLAPSSVDVIVASNLFGDILSDLVAATAGSIGIAPSANINPDRSQPSMFEPVHGTAPDIVGKNLANPIGQLWAGSMMLEHIGQAGAATDLMKAVENTLLRGIRTADLGGTASTSEFVAAVLEEIDAVASAGVER